jgi:hypothetical protein
MGEVDTDLYTIDFTQDPVDSWFFHLSDTVATGSRCLSWVSVTTSNSDFVGKD